MGALERLATGWKITRYSFGLLLEYPLLMLFPLVAGIATALFGGAVILGIIAGDFTANGIEYAFVFLLYFGTTLIATFCNTALVFAVSDVFHGRSPTFRPALRAAWKRKRLVVIWSLLSATIGVILTRLEEMDSSDVSTATMLFSVGWTVITFFVVPVLAFEDVTVGELFSKSAETFRDTWGESLASGFGISVIQFGIGIFGILFVLFISGFVDMAGPGTGTPFLLGGLFVAVLVAYLVGRTVRGITKTALYVYATEGTIPETFSDFDFETLEERSDQPATPGAAGAPSTS